MTIFLDLILAIDPSVHLHALIRRRGFNGDNYTSKAQKPMLLDDFCLALLDGCDLHIGVVVRLRQVDAVVCCLPLVPVLLSAHKNQPFKLARASSPGIAIRCLSSMDML